jgi:nitrogen fixation protein FixH
MTPAEGRQRGWIWAFVPAGLLTLMLSGQAVMISKAVGDPSFSVERDYYRKAVAWDLEREQREHNALLDWKLDLVARPTARGSELFIRLSDRVGAPITDAAVRVEAFFNARASDVATMTLEPMANGQYHATLPLKRAGLWELRFFATRSGQRFTAILRQDLQALP